MGPLSTTPISPQEQQRRISTVEALRKLAFRPHPSLGYSKFPLIQSLEKQVENIQSHLSDKTNELAEVVASDEAVTYAKAVESATAVASANAVTPATKKVQFCY